MNLEQEVQILLIVLIAGLVIVFAALIFLAALVRKYGDVLRSFPQPEEKGMRRVPAGREGIPEEIVAVISAAVSCALPQGAVRSIRRVSASAGVRSPWGMAGVLENTRPF